MKQDNMGHGTETYEQLTAHMDQLYTFATRYLKYMNQPRDYLTEAKISVAEAQLVTLVSDRPGITVTEAAKARNNTLGAISQLVSKLEKKELIVRKKLEGNAKTVHLYSTEKGRLLAVAHRAYNNLRMMQVNQGPVGMCSEEEMSAFYKVLNLLNEVYQ